MYVGGTWTVSEGWIYGDEWCACTPEVRSARAAMDWRRSRNVVDVAVTRFVTSSFKNRPHKAAFIAEDTASFFGVLEGGLATQVFERGLTVLFIGYQRLDRTLRYCGKLTSSWPNRVSALLYDDKITAKGQAPVIEFVVLHCDSPTLTVEKITVVWKCSAQETARSESQVYSTQCRWFNHLVSKADNVRENRG